MDGPQTGKYDAGCEGPLREEAAVARIGVCDDVICFFVLEARMLFSSTRHRQRHDINRQGIMSLRLHGENGTKSTHIIHISSLWVSRSLVEP